MKEQTKFRVIWTAIFVLGLMLAVAPWESWPTIPMATLRPWLAGILTRLLPKLGEAMVVAVVLALVVDQAAKRRLLEEFAREVSTHIIGRRLPRALRKYIEDYLEGDLIRTSWSITYTITEWPGQPEYEKLVTASIYEMENRSEEPKNYECYYEVEKSFFPHIGETKILHATATSLVTPAESFDCSSQSDFVDSVETGMIKFTRTVTLPVHGGPAYRFTLESEECFQDGSIVPFFAAYPVLETTLTVYYPVDRINVFVDLSFGDAAKDATKVALSNGAQCIFNRPMLPGQGFSIRFAKIRSAGVVPANTTVAAVPALAPGATPSPVSETASGNARV